MAPASLIAGIVYSSTSADTQVAMEFSPIPLYFLSEKTITAAVNLPRLTRPIRPIAPA
jgi:hypothetical protein